jgi:hypothetical protein
MYKKSSRNIALSLCLAMPAIALASCTPPAAVTTPSPVVSASPKPAASPSTPPTTASVSPTPAASPSTPPTTASVSPTPASAFSSAPPANPSAPKTGKSLKLSVINNSGKVLIGLYFSPPDKKDWGPNELDGQKVADRDKVDFEWHQGDYKGTEAGCVFDVGAQYADGATTELAALDLCKESSINFK